jgi:hypothetical protein
MLTTSWIALIENETLMSGMPLNFSVGWPKHVPHLEQGCQMVCFQFKIPIWVNFGGP